jgi:hypothetical protein
MFNKKSSSSSSYRFTVFFYLSFIKDFYYTAILEHNEQLNNDLRK